MSEYVSYMWRNIAVISSAQLYSRVLRCLNVPWLSEDVRLVMMRWSVVIWSLNRPGSRTLQWKKPESEGRALTMDREEEDNSENLPTTRHHHQCVRHHRRDCPEPTATCRTSCRSPDRQHGGSRRCGSRTEKVLLSPSTPPLHPEAPPPHDTAAPPCSRPRPRPSPWWPLTRRL